jgi:hypothetical protein
MTTNAVSRLLSTAIGVCLLGLPLLFYSVRSVQRPSQTNVEQPLFQGINYKREFRSNPRPVMIHIVTVDLTAPGIRALVTPGTPTPDNRKVNARTTANFLVEFKLQLAINANYFYPFREKTPWDYYPGDGDRVTTVGQAISNRVAYSAVQTGWTPALCFLGSQRAQIAERGECPQGTTQGISGSHILVARGKSNFFSKKPSDNDSPYPRTAVGIDAEGKKLWLVLIDAKQPFYSEGVTLEELADFLLKLGAYTALNLDGGGSTTLAVEASTGPVLLNAPIHTKLPMRERPVANHLGFYALPIER